MTKTHALGPQAPHHDQPRGQPALLIIDMINCFDFAGAGWLQPKAVRAAHAIIRLKDAMTQAGFPVIYINDNFGEWHSERSRLIERALALPNPVVEMLKPAKDDYFIIKPQFSGFYATNLQVLLPKLGVSQLILTGIATDICVLFTAADAHMRDYALWVPEDAVAAESEDRSHFALETMKKSMNAETATTDALRLQDWCTRMDEADERHES